MQHSEYVEQILIALKDEVSLMREMVIVQVEKAKRASYEKDWDLAIEIKKRKKRVDILELKIDGDVEEYIALHTPKAIDLRLAVSLKKINFALERIGDYAEGIARYVLENDAEKFTAQQIEELQLEKMFDTLIAMLTNCFSAIDMLDTKFSGKVLIMDDEVDAIYRNSVGILTAYLQSNTNLISNGLKIYLLIYRLERIGDYCSNIVEDIIYYIDAKASKQSEKLII
jgi:phosphate transport system protein